MTLADQIRTAVDLSKRAHAHYEHLQESFPDADSAAYWGWFNSHGWKDLPSVADALPPIPPAEVYQHSNTSDEWGYLLTAVSTFRMLDDALKVLQKPWSSVGSILDFGCGPARGVRCLLKYAENLEVYGCDVDKRAITWCNEAMPFGKYAVNGELPPLPYDASTMDLVFSVSVFSHLSKKSQDLWLPELERILRPGGIAVLTIHGEHAAQRGQNEKDIFEMLEVDKAMFEEACSTVLNKKDFAFIPQPDGHLTTDLYGATFMHTDYVKREWTKQFELVDIMVGAVDNWQDAVILRKKS